MGKYIGIVGSIASIVGLFCVNNTVHLVSSIIGLFALLVAIIMEIRDYIKSKPLCFNREENIEYMKKIVSNEGRVIILAGDLSWVDETVKEALKNKGEKLSLCAKETAPFLNELRDSGVHVYTYSSNDFNPNTHFTIVRPDSIDEKIAIASVLDGYKKEKRIVYEFKKYDSSFINNWVMYSAKDLFDLIKLINERNDGNDNTNSKL